MKKGLQQLFLAVGLLLSLISNAGTVTVSGDITANTTWTKNNQYLLTGFVYVKNGATLTIEPGTVIKGDLPTKGTLIVTRTGKINAAGTAAEPIVFTSNQPAGQRGAGDWGGIILLGNAPQNFHDTATMVAIDGTIEGGVNNAAGDGKFGGTNAADNSGVLTYVRIEFPGVAFQPNNEINGLTLGGIGSGTTIHHIQVSYSGDDSYEWFGGTVNADHLIAFRSIDDDFDTDNGFSGKIQFGVCYRDIAASDAVGASNGFESDNDANGSANLPLTGAVFSNMTIIGPRENASTDLTGTYFKRGAHLRRNTSESIFNSVFLGFPIGLFIDGTAAQSNAAANNLVFRYNSFYGCPKMEKAYDSAFVGAAPNNIVWGANTSDAQLTAPYAAAPNAVPQSGSPLLGSADFTNGKLSSGFTTVTYRGAFGANDTWAQGWTEMDPQNRSYDVLAVNDMKESTNIQLMPNPAKQRAYVQLESANAGSVQIKIADVTGRVLLVQQNTISSGYNQLEIDLSPCAAGLYHVQVQTEGTVTTKSLVVE
ncbi:MAG: T9SS type A sorting domain-containing protein [Chitinophagales bacterium]